MALLRPLLHITLLMVFLWSTNAQHRVSSIVKPGCDGTCGDVPVPYPFGIDKSDCYMNPEFAVTCNRTSDGSYQPFLKSIGMEFLQVSFEGYVRVNNSVISSNCGNRTDSPSKVDLSDSSFTYSSLRNKFTVMGCDNYAKLLHNDSVIAGCLSVCDNSNVDGCFGIGCCQTVIPKSLNSFKTSISRVSSNRDASDSTDCRSAFMVDGEWFNLETSWNYTQSIEEMKQREYVPAALEWGYNQGKCDVQSVSFTSLGYSWEEIDQNYLCVCRRKDPFSRSIPYVQQYIGGGCVGEDIPNCLKDADLTNCYLMCVHSPGSQNCLCPIGYYNDGKGRCYKKILRSQSQLKIILIGCGSGIALLLLVIGVWWLYKIVKRRKAIKLKQKYFKRNGGRLLQQQWSSSERNLEQTKMFSFRELEKITDNFHVNRVVGHGGQGTVYKGMLTDGRIVAIKKSKVVDEDKVGQFINEVVILSQIYHRNVVKLLGCCLETEVPLLVYEFVPNGTLYDRIHDPNEEFPITWDMRLSIATEIASALSYLHSAASVPIYHRDIKSSNILLDDKYKVKLSDFGISKSVSIDQTHVTTRVQGTFGYLDPEYFQSNQFTEKSDVFSFGVVLVELLTGKKPISTARSTKERSLVRHFLDLMEEDRLFEILDKRVAKEASEEEIAAVSHITKRCLNLKGKERPTMKTVAMELEEIKASKVGGTFTKDDHEEINCEVGEATSTFDTWDVTSSSIQSYPNSFLEISVDADPLLSELSINNSEFV